MKFYSTIIFLSVSFFGCILNKEKKETPIRSIQNIEFEALDMMNSYKLIFLNDSVNQIRNTVTGSDNLKTHYPFANVLARLCPQSELEKYPLWTTEQESDVSVPINAYVGWGPYTYQSIYFKYKLTGDTNYRYVPDGACKKFLYHTIDSIWVAHKGKITNKAD